VERAALNSTTKRPAQCRNQDEAQQEDVGALKQTKTIYHAFPQTTNRPGSGPSHQANAMTSEGIIGYTSHQGLITNLR